LATIAHLLGLTERPGPTTNAVNAVAVNADVAPSTQKSLAANDTDGAVGDTADPPGIPAARARHQFDRTLESAVTARPAAGKQPKDRADTTVKRATERLGKMAHEVRRTVQKVSGANESADNSVDKSPAT
jgi:hypothetical protein